MPIPNLKTQLSPRAMWFPIHVIKIVMGTLMNTTKRKKKGKTDSVEKSNMFFKTQYSLEK